MSCPSSIRHWDSNPQPSERESPPITTRTGLNNQVAIVSPDGSAMVNITYCSVGYFRPFQMKE